MAIIEDANTTVLVVGGSSGMGLALATRCLDAGAKVIIAGRNPDRLRRAREELQYSEMLETVAVNIAEEDEVAEMFERIGRLDHIVSTAADIDGAYELLPSLDLKAAQRVVESKFYGPLLLAKHGAPVLSATGSITFTSGIAAYRPSARGSIVAAVNAALEGLVRALAIGTGPHPGQCRLARLGRHANLVLRCRRQERRDAERDGKATAGRACRTTRRHCRCDRLSDGQHLHDRDDTARRGRASADLTGAIVPLTAARNSFSAAG